MPAAADPLIVAVDVVVLTAEAGALRVLVLERGHGPWLGRWALPGGFVAPSEGLEEAARRVLAEKVGVRDVWIEQLYTFGRPDRDPRTRVVSVAWMALVDAKRLREMVGDRAAIGTLDVPWADETGGPVRVRDAGGQALDIAFDHDDILGVAVKRIRGKLRYTAVGFQLLPETFTLRQLQAVHETVLARPLNKDSFRRSMLASGALEATGEREAAVGHRPAELYRFLRRSAI